MTSKIKQSGFTIIEVTLFLAVTGLLLLIALIGTGGTIATTRFGDSVRSLESKIEQQYDLILNGANQRPAEWRCRSDGSIEVGGSQKPGQSNDCIILGKLLAFETEPADNFRIFDVIGLNPDEIDDDASEQELILDYEPLVVREEALENEFETYSVIWEAEIFKKIRNNKDGTAPTDIDAIALLRGPRTGAIYAYAFNWSNNNKLKSDISSDSASHIGDSRFAEVCLRSVDNGQRAIIQIGGGQGPANVTATFDKRCD